MIIISTQLRKKMKRYAMFVTSSATNMVYNETMTRFIYVCVLALVLILNTEISSAYSIEHHLGASSGPIRTALDKAGLKPVDVQINADDLKFFGGDKYRLPMLDVFFNDPWKISPYSRSITDGMLKTSESISTSLIGTHRRLNLGSRLGLLSNPLEPYLKRISELKDQSLVTAITELDDHHKPATYQGKPYEQIPAEVRDAAALLLLVLPDVLELHDLAVVKPLSNKGLNPNEIYNQMLDMVVNEGNDSRDSEDEDTAAALTTENVIGTIDWNVHYTAATLMSVAIEYVKDKLVENKDKLAGANYEYWLQTKYGWLVLTGGSDTEYPVDNYLLVIDTSGNDDYCTNGGTRDFSHPVSINLDLTGNDKYDNRLHDSPAFGAGVFGYGFLVDCAGNDSYFNEFVGQGCGIFGCGTLQDLAGDDKYNGIGNLQGSAAFGSGLLIDLVGNDTYDAYVYSQGYGYTLGSGILIDNKGNDIYRANTTDIRYNGPFGDPYNINFVQGIGFGRRADGSDGHSWAGGCGILIEGEGNDLYINEVYGMGSAYWYAIGILADKSGNDKYQAGWYSLGSSPHFAIGVFQDDLGDDVYWGKRRQNLGNGRDFSIGWFEESAGNDIYYGAPMSFGTGDINGIGFFWDKAGNDSYTACTQMFGQSNIEGSGSLRDFMLTLGLFVDGGGTDKYYLRPSKEGQMVFELFTDDITKLPILDFCGDNQTWLRPISGVSVMGAKGVGIDIN